ncbi:MAG TPA: DUF4097 family beta strand repeat-containing protein [Candidatus Acidoferrum sp.]|nr:DUF4097 family beta strand repeat-containing protein [Candidatus Acidoferrum sp.]
MRLMCWTGFLIVPVLFAPLIFADEWHKTFPVSGKPDLRIDVGDGSVSIHPSERNEIDARVTTQGWKISDSEVRIVERQNGNRVEIDVRVPHLNISFGHRSIHLELLVPRELSAQIHSGDGRISAQDLKGELHFSSGDGAIEADSIDGVVEAKSGDGRIRVSGRWERLDVETQDGSVEAEARAGSKMAGSWRVHTGDGHVTLRLPETFAADLDVHTGDGKITIDFPVTTSGSFGGSEVRGKLNGGGQTLVVHTGDGPIHIQRL